MIDPIISCCFFDRSVVVLLKSDKSRGVDRVNSKRLLRFLLDKLPEIQI